MKHFFKHSVLSTLLLFSTSLFTQNPNGWDTAWVNSFGGVGIETGRDLKETPDKGFITIGTTSTFGNGNTSFYVIKTDVKGKHQWSKTISGPNNNTAYSVDLADDGGYFFSGVSNSNLANGYDGYLVKTDKDGKVLWTKNYGSEDWDFIYNSCKMPDGGLILCGETHSKTKGGTDFYMIRTDLNGDTLWTKKLGSTGNDAFYAVEQKNNRIYAVGKTFDAAKNISRACIYKFDFSGAKLLDSLFLDKSDENSLYTDLCITSLGQVLLSGKRYTNSYTNCILARVDTANLMRNSYLTTNQNMYFNSVTEGTNNDIYVLGKNNESASGLGGTSAVYYRFNQFFGFINVANFGGVVNEEGFEIIPTSNGYTFIGTTTSYGNQNNSIEENVYLVVFNKLNLVGNYFLIVTEFTDDLSLVGVVNQTTNNQKVGLYPNPMINSYKINFHNPNLEGKTVELYLYDSQGKQVLLENYKIINSEIFIERGDLLNGSYSFRLIIESNVVGSGKLIAK